MLITRRRQRTANVYLWAIAVLVLLFAGLVVYFGYWRRQSAFNEDLIAELRDAVFLEDENATRGKDWPQWRGPRRDGVSAETGLLETWPKGGPPQLGEAKTGEGYSSVSVVGGRVYSLVRIDDEEVVICWDADLEKELWHQAYPCDFQNTYPGTRSTPTVDGDRVYTVGAKGRFLCLEAATGKKLWEHDLLDEFGAKNPAWGLACSPLVDERHVYVNPGGPKGNALAAFDKRSGDLVWKSQDDPAGYSSPVAITAGGVRQIVFFTGHSLVGVSPDDGKLCWRYPWETEHGVNAATPIWFQARAGDRVGDYLFITSDYGKGCALLKVEKTRSGPAVERVFENKDLCCRFSSPVRHKDHVYGFSDPGVLTCMSLRDGQVKWTKQGFQQGSLMRAGDLLIILGEQGKLALAEVTPEEYREKASYQVFRRGDRCWSVPVLADGRLYVRNQDVIRCLDLRAAK